MSNPNREVNGNGRILYHILKTRECISPSTWGGYPKTEIVRSELHMGHIEEWSPSGEYLRINNHWHPRCGIELLEVLP